MKSDLQKNFRRLSFAVPAGFNVDREAGVLKNLVLLEGGREAKGHGLYIDAETIRTAHASALSRGQLKGAIRHLSWEEMFSKGADRVLDFPGWFEGFSVKAAQLVASKFEFYETFRTSPDSAPAFARIMEIADKTPNLFGLSIEAWGYAVFVAEDGKEYGTKPDGVALKYDGVPALRITDLFFAAFVDEPAATDGLFAKFAAKFPAVAALFGGKQDSATAELVAQLRAFADSLAASGSAASASQLSTLNSQPRGSAAHSAGPLPAPSASPENSTMQIIAALKAKFTDATRFAAAMNIVGQTPADKLAALTVGDVESQLTALDLAAAQADVSKLKADLAARDTSLTALSAERDSWKTKYETLKASGKDTPANLGAGAGTGGSNEGPNPFATETLNYTKQAELQKADPARAAQLKAAAAGK